MAATPDFGEIDSAEKLDEWADAAARSLLGDLPDDPEALTLSAEAVAQVENAIVTGLGAESNQAKNRALVRIAEATGLVRGLL